MIPSGRSFHVYKIAITSHREISDIVHIGLFFVRAFSAAQILFLSHGPSPVTYDRSLFSSMKELYGGR